MSIIKGEKPDKDPVSDIVDGVEKVFLEAGYTEISIAITYIKDDVVEICTNDDMDVRRLSYFIHTLQKVLFDSINND